MWIDPQRRRRAGHNNLLIEQRSLGHESCSAARRAIASCRRKLACFAACGGASDVEHPADRRHQANTDLDWRDQVIYQIMVDRFANGDPNNDFNVAPSVPGRFHGGDWQGVIDHLDSRD
jgi:hypothetical protein